MLLFFIDLVLLTHSLLFNLGARVQSLTYHFHLLINLQGFLHDLRRTISLLQTAFHSLPPQWFLIFSNSWSLYELFFQLNYYLFFIILSNFRLMLFYTSIHSVFHIFFTRSTLYIIIFNLIFCYIDSLGAYIHNYWVILAVVFISIYHSMGGRILFFQNSLGARLLLWFWKNFFFLIEIIIISVIHCFVFINHLNILFLKLIFFSQWV